MTTKVFMLSLGCSKNQVNAEMMLALLRQEGMEIVDDPAAAQVAVVNTCGFIDDAKSEAIDSILALAPLKEQGVLQAIVVTGCLAERYRQQVLELLPEVDVVVGTGSCGDIAAAVRGALQHSGTNAYFAPQDEGILEGERVLLTPSYYAYLRIAEGCDNRCAYCVIPYLRGRFRSRRMEDIVAEARKLAENGVRELLIIAQDTSRYGTDLYGERRLDQLLQQLAEIDGIDWIRIHYLYPDEIDDSLLETIANCDKIVKYFDIPIQHINDRVLQSMNRRGDGALIRHRIAQIRSMMPDAVIRTSLIVGFPGETEEEYQELYDFLEEYRLQRVGVFAYSQEEGSPAAEMPDQIDPEIKERRRAEIYRLQEEIMEESSAAWVGKTLRVLCCGRDADGNLYGRSYMDSPDIDGIVYFESETVQEGQFADVQITYAEGCDLYGKPVAAL